MRGLSAGIVTVWIHALGAIVLCFTVLETRPVRPPMAVVAGVAAADDDWSSARRDRSPAVPEPGATEG